MTKPYDEDDQHTNIRTKLDKLKKKHMTIQNECHITDDHLPAW